ncbi:DUF2894 domain-containing protein [uncultured Aquabacterium sp.]|uniref:DUF2894 domain-containing protein n=1 Tax=Aquabacterium sp. TaxID=1872578 RepID=UPI0025CCB6B3|nr:DUF2894 domain-containing protein [uncultured Aquabacterium sp.]
MNEGVLAELQAQGADQRDPVRYHYLAALLKRMAGQPESVQRLLAPRVEAAVAALAPPPQPFPTPAAPSADGARALARLNQYLHERSREEPVTLLPGEEPSAASMKSVRRFSEVWSKIAAEQQVSQAVARGPENAGPLNSHRLMLRALGLMRGLSPDYLRRFLEQMDALLWLDQATRRPGQAEGKDGKAGRRAAPRKG